MLSRRENILSSVVEALAVLPATVGRDIDCPASVPPRGLVIVRSAAPEIMDETLGYPRSYYMGLDVPLELYVVGTDPAVRARSLDLLASSAYTALLSDLNLMNQLSYIEPLLLDPETISDTGKQTIAASQFTVRVEYETQQSIG